MDTRTTTSPRSSLRFPALAAAVILGLALAGCNKAEAPGASTTTPAAPASSSSSSATPSAAPSTAPSAPASSSSAAPTSSTATPGTPQGAAGSVPSGGSIQSPAPGAQGAVDAKETNPTGDLTKKEEKSAMPEALHGNNHSSPALDEKKQ